MQLICWNLTFLFCFIYSDKKKYIMLIPQFMSYSYFYFKLGFLLISMIAI